MHGDDALGSGNCWPILNTYLQGGNKFKKLLCIPITSLLCNVWLESYSSGRLSTRLWARIHQCEGTANELATHWWVCNRDGAHEWNFMTSHSIRRPFISKISLYVRVAHLKRQQQLPIASTYPSDPRSRLRIWVAIPFPFAFILHSGQELAFPFSTKMAKGYLGYLYSWQWRQFRAVEYTTKTAREWLSRLFQQICVAQHDKVSLEIAVVVCTSLSLQQPST